MKLDMRMDDKPIRIKRHQLENVISDIDIYSCCDFGNDF